VAKADWSDDAVLAAAQARVLPVIEPRGPIQVLIVDDTGIPKKASAQSAWRQGNRLNQD
jgi:SRSO17 transposase